MTNNEICTLADDLKRGYKTKNPVRLCEEMGVCLLYQPMGYHCTAIKGFMLSVDRVQTIVVNSDLPENIQRVIIAHELCHALKHCTDSMNSYKETDLFNEASQFEKEANLFAAELLIEDEDVMKAYDEYLTFYELAADLYVPAGLLDFKFRMMKHKGYDLPDPPEHSRNNFLGSIRTSNEQSVY